MTKNSGFVGDKSSSFCIENEPRKQSGNESHSPEQKQMGRKIRYYREGEEDIALRGGK